MNDILDERERASALEHLDAARALIEDPRHYCRGALKRRRWWLFGPFCYCPLGALREVEPHETEGPRFKRMVKMLVFAAIDNAARRHYRMGIVGVNGGLDHATALDCFDLGRRTIETARSCWEVLVG